MVLQPFSFPKDKELAAHCRELYYRVLKGSAELSNGIITLSKGSVISFDTRFGAFFPKQWVEYTNISSLGVAVSIEGGVNVRLYHTAQGEKSEETRRIEESKVAVTPDFCSFEYGELSPDGMYWFEVEALSEGAKIFGGRYFDNSLTPQRDAKIALCVCSFKTGDIVSERAAMLKRELMDNQKSPCFGKLAMFVSDNSRTMRVAQLPQTDDFVLLSNKNTGGTGGFTRCMLEVIKSGEYTHCLLSDDDAYAEPQAYERLICFVNALKPECADMPVGGAIMRGDRKEVQYEASADWNSGKMQLFGAALDMSKRADVLRCADMQLKADYCGWWFCCIPVDIIKESGLPLPIFIHRDDIEYGLRSGGVLSLNGVCVWHDAFERKHSGCNEYYDIRNMGIVNALYCEEYTAKAYFNHIFKRCLQNILQYKYAYCDMAIRGAKDFLEGPSLLKSSDAQGLHKEIMRLDYKKSDASSIEAYSKIKNCEAKLNKQNDKIMSTALGDNIVVRFGDKALNALAAGTLGGFFLPKFHTKICAVPTKPYKCYMAKSAVHIDDAGKGFVCEYSFAELKRIMKELAELKTLLEAQYPTMAQSWRRAKDELCSERFWKKYLSQK